MPAAAVPAELRLQAQALLIQHGGSNARRPADRRRYVGDPWAYIADVLGVELWAEGQGEALEAFERHDRVLVPAGNGTGKSLLLACYAIYRYDAVAALPSEHHEEQGGRILLVGPSAATVKSVVYSQMLELMARAEQRGYPMPGMRSEASVLCRVRPLWEVEAFAPPRRVAQQVTHAASGRHHRNMVALVDEGQGVGEATWRAVEGMCSGEGNKILSPFNPTEGVGPAYARSRLPAWHVVHLSALDHPNVRERREVIPGAISAGVIDDRVSQCVDLGPARDDLEPDPVHGDFYYALPPDGSGVGPARKDGIPGDARGEVHLWRPTPIFQGQVLGQWPAGSTTGLFDPASIQRAQERWRQADQSAPDRIGLDLAGWGDDETLATPAHGPPVDALLRRYYETGEKGRLRLDWGQVVPQGEPDEVAAWISQRWPGCAVNLDEGGIGGWPGTYLKSEHGMEARGVSFAADPPEPLKHEPPIYNLRAAMYRRLAVALRLDLVDLPPDEQLREELLATETRWLPRTVEDEAKRVTERKDCLALVAKDKIKAKIGRSPDRADSAVLAAHEVVVKQAYSAVIRHGYA